MCFAHQYLSMPSIVSGTFRSMESRVLLGIAVGTSEKMGKICILFIKKKQKKPQKEPNEEDRRKLNERGDLL